MTRCAVRFQRVDDGRDVYVVPEDIAAVLTSFDGEDCSILYTAGDCVGIVVGSPVEVLSKLGIPIQPE